MTGKIGRPTFAYRVCVAVLGSTGKKKDVAVANVGRSSYLHIVIRMDDDAESLLEPLTVRFHELYQFWAYVVSGVLLTFDSNYRYCLSVTTKQVKTIEPAVPDVDNDYFDADYKQALQTYWIPPYKEELHLPYLIDFAVVSGNTRGFAYRKFAPTLFKLGIEYLCPESVAKYDGHLFKWELRSGLPKSNFGGMKDLLLSLNERIDTKEDDWHLPVGVSLMMCLRDEPCSKKKPSWNPWFFLSKSTIDRAGNGLFAAREFQKGETIGFYMGNVIYRYPSPWTKKVSDEYLKDRDAMLEDDTRTMGLIDKEGFRVLVNPYYGKDKGKIVPPPLLMGIHFLNDFNKIYEKDTDEKLKRKTDKMNNVWVDDQGGVKACRRIFLNEELFLSYEGKGILQSCAKSRREGKDDKKERESKKQKFI